MLTLNNRKRILLALSRTIMSAIKLAAVHRVKVLEAGWSPRTDRFYPKDALTNMVKQFASGGLGDFIFSGDEISLRLDLHNVSHRTNKLYTKNDGTELWAEIQLLDTRCGRLVRDFIKSKNIRFDALMVGHLNNVGEVQAETLQYIRVCAFGVYT